jgi:uncharacterized membrane protein (UPF0127 family)
MVTNFGIKYKGKRFKLEVQECKTLFEKAHGLMFKKQSKPLLFIFKRPIRAAIHSCFCQPFLAIWLRKNKVVDEKFVNKWKFSIRPKERYDRLLEIPTSSKEFSKFYRR